MKINVFSLSIIFFILLSSCKTDDVIEEAENSEELCPRNVDIGLQAVTAESATIKWLETQGFASNYEYGEKGFVLGTGIKGSTPDENVTITDLKAGTEYDFYLQSICTAEITGEFISKPYAFTTLSCTDLNADKISIVGYVENGDFQINLYPTRYADEWQVALLPSSTAEPSNNDISIWQNSTVFVFSDIDPIVQYNFYVRAKCDGIIGDWIIKDINPGDESLFSPCLTRVQNLSVISGNISFSVLTSSTIITEIIEENTDKESGITIESNGYFYFDSASFHINYPEYVKPATNYEVYTRVKCGSSFSEYVKVYTFKSPYYNAAYFTEANITGENVQLLWLRDYGFNNAYCQPYNQVVYEIEYGLQGFVEGEGVFIETAGESVGSNYYYNLPLNALESGSTYEFSIRSVVHGTSRSNWNSSCGDSTVGRFVFTAS
ncbi:fibronectin type III domain-containing protein [uncultured Maribacter sp.]|uniref:fibronectin type III domain-containing protein n=1 Tax=uncultured Maribacter sp. TaxID=431308 RepID=UPI002635C567|nr:fibronectin type III domain-containing protein [uncultured Maribacter sp.]